MNKPSWDRAFTLVELLVVIGIIAVLVGILLPVVSRVRESGSRTACMAQMKQVGNGMLMYVNDNKGAFPKPSKVAADASDAIYWQASRIKDVGRYGLGPYLKMSPTDLRMFRCVSDEQADGRMATGKYPFTYSINDNMGGDGLQAVRKLGQVRVPAEKVLLFEENGVTLDDASARLWDVHGAWNGISLLGLRHDRMRRKQFPDSSSAATGVPNLGGYGNVLFTDWHVGYVPRMVAQGRSHVLPDASGFAGEPEVGP